MTERLLMTMPEVCDFLKVSRATVYREMGFGPDDLPFVKVRARTMFRVEAVEEYLRRKVYVPAGGADQAQVAP